MSRIPDDLLERLRDLGAPESAAVSSLEGPAASARFRLEGRVGAGGMGEVFRAFDQERQLPVAVKLLGSLDDEHYQRFQREAAVLAQLSHPAIVGYVAHGRLGTRAFLAMDWLEGETLAERLDRAGLTSAETLALARRVSAALALVHEHGVVHRDVKPSNVFLPQHDPAQAVLIDFGIARRPLVETSLTATGFAVGTVGYMAPEQARGAEWVDARADVFALGAVLYKCLTGRRAFRGADPMAVLAKTVFSEPPRARALIAEVPPALDELVARMLEKDPRARPSDGHAVALALDAIGPVDDERRAPDSGAYPMLTRGERRLASVLVVSPAASAPRSEAATSVVASGSPAWGRWSAAARAHGVRLDPLADGSIVASLGKETAALDAVLRLARAALALSASSPRARSVLCTGRGQSGGGDVPAEVVDRAAKMLARLREPRAGQHLPAVCLDRVSAALLGGRFDVATLGTELALIGERGADVESRRVAPHVGRKRELEALDALLRDSLAANAPRAAILTGPAGIGKTRLWKELVRRSTRAGMRHVLWVARADPARPRSPYALLGDVLSRALGVHPGEATARIRDKLRARLAARGADADTLRRSERLIELFQGAEADAPAFDPSVSAERLLSAWLGWVQLEVATSPLLIVFDDAQWGDLPSLNLAARAARLGRAPVVLVCAGRPELSQAFPGLWNELAPLALELQPLSRKSRLELLSELLPQELPRLELVRLADASDGNPFALEELARVRADRPDAPLPESVLALSESRLSRLGRDSRAVLRAASVFGTRAWPGAIEELEQDVDVEGAIEELLRHDLLSHAPTSRFASEPELAFRQSLIREAAYAELTEHDRALGHRLAAAWLERMGETDPVVLGEHWDRGGEPGHAAVQYQRAARQALAGNDFPAAISRAERALANIALDRAAGGAPHAPGTLGSLELTLAEAKRWSGDARGALGHAEAARGLLGRGGRSWFSAMAELAAVLGRIGEYDRLEAVLSEVAAERTPAAERSAQIGALCPGTSQLLQAGRTHAADRLVVAIEALAGRGLIDVAAQARLEQLRGFYSLGAGDPWRAMGCYAQAREAFSALGSARHSAVEQVNFAHAALEAGAFEAADAALGQALFTAELLGLETVRAVAELNRGRLALGRGELAQAERSQGVALEIGMRERSPRVSGAARVHLARVALRRGDALVAEAEAQAAAALLEVAPPLRVGALATLAEAQLEAGQPKEAEASAARALAAIAPGRAEMFDVLARWVSVRVALSLGDAARGREELGALLKELEARSRFAGDAAGARAFLERVEVHANVVALARELGLG